MKDSVQKGKSVLGSKSELEQRGISHGRELGFVGLLGLTASLIAGCFLKGSEKVEYDTDLNATRNGCVQGALVDGNTGKPLSVPYASGTSGVYVLVRNIPLPAIAIGSSLGKPDGKKSEADGSLFSSEYLVCNVPVDETFPIFAYMSGYLPFESSVSIPSSINPSSSGDIIKKTASTLLANIRLFPIGTETRDFVFFVTNNGKPLASANVILSAPTTGFITQPDTFLTPFRFRGGSIAVMTGTDGLAIFSSDILALGMTYNYLVTPPKTSIPLTTASGTVVVGLYSSAPAGNATSSYLPIELNSTLPTLAILSSTLENSKYESTGSIVIQFNRPVELAPGTLDNLTAALNNNGTGTTVLPANVAGNDASEQASISISGNQLTITPVFTFAPAATAAASDRSLSITYTLTAVMVRPAGNTGTTPAQALSTLIAVTGQTPIVSFYQ